MAGTDRRTSAEGCLVGLACGDALGRPLEFRTPSSIEDEYGRVTELLGYGTHGQPAGTVSDDTEMALCIARSLAVNGGFDGADVADRFADWLASGPFDVGLMTRDAIQTYASGTDWDRAGPRVWADRSEGENAGNGSVMRCAPYALAYHDDQFRRGFVSKRSSAITHADPRCTYGCILLNDVLAALLNGKDVDLADVPELVHPEAPQALREYIEALPSISESNLETSGYVLSTLQTALYDALTAETAEAAIVQAANRGGDADTIAAVTGAIAGARFGRDALPDRWTEQIDETRELAQLASQLLDLSHETGDHSGQGVTVANPAPSTPTYLRPNPPIESGGHRPAPTPTQILDVDPREMTAGDAVAADWLRRAYRRSDQVRREIERGGDRAIPDGLDLHAQPEAVRVPEYCRVDSLAALPPRDKRWITHELQRALQAADGAVDAIEALRDRILVDEQVAETGQLAAATRTPLVLLNIPGPVTDLLSSPRQIERLHADAIEAVECLSECCSLLAVLSQTTAVEEGLDQVQTALGRAQACADGLYAAGIRHPEISFDGEE